LKKCSLQLYVKGDGKLKEAEATCVLHNITSVQEERSKRWHFACEVKAQKILQGARGGGAKIFTSLTKQKKGGMEADEWVGKGDGMRYYLLERKFCGGGKNKINPHRELFVARNLRVLPFTQKRVDGHGEIEGEWRFY